MEAKLIAKERSHSGKKYARKIRKEGQIPGVIYGQKKEVKHIQMDEVAFKKILRQKQENFQIEINGGVEKVKIQDMQIDTLEEKILHVDFLRVN